MRTLNSFLKTAALGAGITATAADAATIDAPKNLLFSLNENMMEQAITAPQGPLLGQVRIIPATGDAPESNAQVYAVSDDLVRSCMIAGGANAKHAFQPEAYEKSAGNIAGLFNGGMQDISVPLESLKFNAPYIQVVENEDRAFVRVQMGFPIENAVIKVGDTVIAGDIEASNYTIKVTDAAAVEAIKTAYLNGDAIQAVGLSENGHTMAYSFANDGSAEKTFNEDCLQNLDKAQIPYNEYVSIRTTPVENAPDSMIQELIGTQCLRDTDIHDVKNVLVVESMTGGISPFSHALEMRDGRIVIADYLSVEPNGDIRISASWQQSLENHTVNSCAGTKVAEKPPVLTSVPNTPVTPPVLVGFVPPTPTPFVPPYNPPFFPPTTPPHGCVVNCNPTNPPAPVPLPLTGGLLLAGLGAMALMRRRPEREEALSVSAPKATLSL